MKQHLHRICRCYFACSVFCLLLAELWLSFDRLEFFMENLLTLILSPSQTLTLPSVVFPPTCSSPTSNVRTSARRTQESPSVSPYRPRPRPFAFSGLIPSPPNLGQVGKVLGERWKALSDKQRGPYEAKAAADKKRYEDEKAAYQVTLATASPDF